MKLRMRIQVHKVTIAICGLIFGGAQLANAQDADSSFVNRVQAVQNNLSSKMLGNFNPRPVSTQDSYWGNEIGSGWANAWCGPYWANASDDNNGWANAWANC